MCPPQGEDSMVTVAIVEDNPDNRLLLTALLGDLFTLQVYVDGAEALAGMRARVPGVVILDISLPGMDGGEVLRNMRADPVLADLPVIALTAHAMTGDRERFLSMGFDSYMTKPIVDENLLFSTIRTLAATLG